MIQRFVADKSQTHSHDTLDSRTTQTRNRKVTFNLDSGRHTKVIADSEVGSPELLPSPEVGGVFGQEAAQRLVDL